jgi:hypothetical protein
VIELNKNGVKTPICRAAKHRSYQPFRHDRGNPVERREGTDDSVSDGPSEDRHRSSFGSNEGGEDLGRVNCTSDRDSDQPRDGGEER